MAIELREVGSDKRRVKDFLNVVDTIYASDPAYVRPLDMEVTDKLNTKKNPFFEHAEGIAWVAYDGERPVGRITAQVDREHLKRHADGAGFFGYFDTKDDGDTAKLLLAEAAKWLKAHGMEKMRGPFSLSINEETGCLIDGFQHPPMIGMPHHLPYQSKLIEASGFTKLKDFYAWTYEVGKVPPRAQKAHDEIAALPEITSRYANPKDMLNELRTITEIFNDAWSDNWGFVPSPRTSSRRPPTT